MSKRTSVNAEGYRHANPIPAASRIGNLMVSGIVYGQDPATGKVAPTLEEQCVLLFRHVRNILAAGGARPENVIKMNLWLADPSRREALNAEWLKMFPDEASRPARQAMKAELGGGMLIHCDFMAVID
jgi:enamine deaminase RidA (YjgF/YER057c/UK114 family)